MAPKMNVAYVEKYSTEEHLREIRSNRTIIADMVESNVKVKCMVNNQVLSMEVSEALLIMFTS